MLKIHRKNTHFNKSANEDFYLVSVPLELFLQCLGQFYDMVIS
jgi:hypothetical protein